MKQYWIDFKEDTECVHRENPVDFELTYYEKNIVHVIEIGVLDAWKKQCEKLEDALKNCGCRCIRCSEQSFNWTCYRCKALDQHEQFKKDVGE